MKIIAISPSPSGDEAAAIVAALARMFAPPVNPTHEPDRWRTGRDGTRASLEYYAGESRYAPTSWREAARAEALDAGV